MAHGLWLMAHADSWLMAGLMAHGWSKCRSGREGLAGVRFLREVPMTIDRYTKAVLTVIAGCLLWMCVMGAGQRVSAQQGSLDLARFVRDPAARPQPVVIVGTGSMDQLGNVDIKLAEDRGKQRTDPTIPVALAYVPAKPLPVSLPYPAANPMPSQLFYSAQLPLPVEIASVRKTGQWEPIRTQVEDAPTRKTPGYDK